MDKIQKDEIIDKYRNCDYGKVALGQTVIIGILSLVMLIFTCILVGATFIAKNSLENALTTFIVIDVLCAIIFIMVSILFIIMLVTNTRVLRKPEDYRYTQGIVTDFKSASLLKVAKITIKASIEGIEREVTGQYLTKQTTMIAFVKVGITADVLISVSKKKIIVLSLQEGEEGIPLMR